MKGERMGKTEGIRVGRERKVFSRIRAEIYVICELRKVRRKTKKRGRDGGGITLTLSGFRLAKSIATAPPIDWPYNIYQKNKNTITNV